MSEQSAVSAGSIPGTRFSAAVEIVQPWAVALPAERVKQIYVDVPTTVTTIPGAIPAINAVRA
jgi:hypothetical protein